MPKKICHQCLEQLKIAKEIKEKCIESQEILKKFIVPTKEPTEKLVFIDVVKQELKNEEEDRYRQCTIVELPSPDLELQIPEFDKLFVDSFACDSHDSESEFFVPFTKKTVDTFRRKQMKIVIPRIDPFSFDNPNEKNFICDKCGEEFLNRTSFLAHYRKAHKRLRINQCKICMQSFQ